MLPIPMRAIQNGKTGQRACLQHLGEWDARRETPEESAGARKAASRKRRQPGATQTTGLFLQQEGKMARFERAYRPAGSTSIQ